MITVRIDKAKNCNGEWAIFVSFPYSNDIVNTIREFPSRYWNKDKKEWELPLDRLGQLTEKLPDEEFDISGQYVPMAPKEFKMPEGFEFKTKPFKHQIEGFEYGMQYDRWLLGDEMGCISGDCEVKIKEENKPATRDIKLKYLYTAFQKDKTIQIKCLSNGHFRYMPIKNVVYKGNKKVYRITLDNGNFLICTPDHKIYSEAGWIEADKLKMGDKVFTNGKEVCPKCGTDKNLITYPYSKFLGYCKSCMYSERNGKIYKEAEIVEKLDEFGYVRMFGKATRTMPNYKQLCNKGGIYKHHQVWYENTGHIVDTSFEVVHHKNGIKTDNRFENLELLTKTEHAKLTSDTKTKHLYQFNENLDYVMRGKTKIYLVPNLEKIVSIEDFGMDDVYDISIEDKDIHNFICNNIIVHNCGKTKQAVDIAIAKRLQKGYQHCLIICGVNGLKWNWMNEIKTHSNEHGYILGQRGNKIGSNKDKLEDAINLSNNDNYFIITNVESVRDENISSVLASACKAGVIGMIVADEIHKMKNASSQQGKGFLKLQAETMIAMTGTPLMNNPMDLYVILKWLGYEKHAFYSFKNHYCVMGGYGGYEILGYKNLDELREQLDKMMLRRLKNDVLDLPEKTYIDEYVEMSPKQAQIYREVTMEIKAHIDEIAISPNPLAELIRMRQATGYTGILSSKIKESAKLDRMEELVEEAVNNGKKVLIFSNWTQMTDAICERLDRKYRYGLITGQTPDVIRQDIVDKFQTEDSMKVVVGTIGAAGTGITMTAATVEIFMDEPWNQATKEQAVDRAYRVGTKENVTIYTLLCKGTIDERIHDMVYQKGAMADMLVDGKIKQDRRQVLDFLLD